MRPTERSQADLLLPYFKFEAFADKSVLTQNNMQTQNNTNRMNNEKCCLGDGQLSCLMGRANKSAQGVQTQPHSNLSHRQNNDLLSKAPGAPRSPVIGLNVIFGSSKQPLINLINSINFIAPGASSAIRGRVKTE